MGSKLRNIDQPSTKGLQQKVDMTECEKNRGRAKRTISNCVLLRVCLREEGGGSGRGGRGREGRNKVMETAIRSNAEVRASAKSRRDRE